MSVSEKGILIERLTNLVQAMEQDSVNLDEVVEKLEEGKIDTETAYDMLPHTFETERVISNF